MDDVSQTNAEQSALWNGSAGRAWVELQHVLDGAFAPLEALLVDAVRAQGARRVLDVGCGTGATTLAIARSLPAGGRCVGVDISGPMIALARTRAHAQGAAADFLRADAQTHRWPMAFDMVVSRFGMMFFDDPVAAFANLRVAARGGAALASLAWRSPAENPFMTAAERKAASLLPGLPPREPNAPGQFAFADPRRVAGILKESGWVQADIEAVDVPCCFPERELARYFTHLGPVGRVLSEADAQTRRRVVAEVRGAFDPYVRDGEVRFTAACWMLRARSPAS